MCVCMCVCMYTHITYIMYARAHTHARTHMYNVYHPTSSLSLKHGCYVLMAGAALAVVTGHAVTEACQRALASPTGGKNERRRLSATARGDDDVDYDDDNDEDIAAG